MPCSDEIFGPVQVILKFKTMDEVRGAGWASCIPNGRMHVQPSSAASGVSRLHPHAGCLQQCCRPQLSVVQ